MDRRLAEHHGLGGWGAIKLQRARAPRVLRIDHAFVQALRVEEFRVERLAGSDHDAIVVDVTTD